MSPSPPRQRLAFLDGEGDAYFDRNRAVHEVLEHRLEVDPLLCAYRAEGLSPRAALEIGASDGWRLACLARTVGAGARLVGVDPSRAAVEAGRARFPELDLHVGTAVELPLEDGAMELVTFGFCLYLCDREDLFRVAAEANRVLAEGGVLALYDFHADVPYRNPYGPREGLSSFKFDAARLFTWNPAYRVLRREVFPHPLPDGSRPERWAEDDLVAVTLLRKDTPAGWPTKDDR